MTAQKGKDFLLKIADKDDQFITVAGMRSNNLTFNATPVDITNIDSTGRWRELLAGAGIKKASISGSGIFKDSDSDKQIKDVFINDIICRWQIIIPDFATITGLFQLVALEYSGEYDGEIRMEMALESAGKLTITSL